MPAFIDLTGKRFGNLYVIKRVKNSKSNQVQFLTRCEVEGCGNEKVVKGDRLTRKTYPMTHCGCLTVHDLTGKRFGSLLIIDRAKNDKRNQVCWNYICHCGKNGVVSGDHLTRKTNPTTHCGCLTNQHKSDAQKGLLHSNYKHGLTGTSEYNAEQTHKRRMRKQKNNAGADFSYDKIDKPDLDYCVYCGSIDKPTVDHIMPITKGGTQDPKNLIRACMSCNQSKNASFFIDWYSKSKDKRNLRSLDEIIKDMGFDDLEDLTNYQDELENNAWHNYGLIY